MIYYTDQKSVLNPNIEFVLATGQLRRSDGQMIESHIVGSRQNTHSIVEHQKLSLWVQFERQIWIR